MNVTQRNVRNTDKMVGLLEADGMNIELLVATEILKLNSLHYGYWDTKGVVTLESFKKAQGRYTAVLVESIPEGVGNVLDIGCGIGDNARAMAKAGYHVTAMSPDLNHGKFFEKLDASIVFHNCKLQDFDSDEKFDLMLLSESQTYFDPKFTFRACNKNLNSRGYLMVSDMFNTTSTVQQSGVTHTEEAYVQEASEYGLELISSTDITSNILPSLELANSVYTQYAQPALTIADLYARKIAPVKYLLVKAFFAKQLRILGKVVTHYEKRLSPDFFTKNLRYVRLLFRYNQDH